MPDSQAQVRWAHSVLEGGASGDKSFASEVVNKMHGRSMSSLPERGSTSRRLAAAKRKKDSRVR